MGTKQSKEEQIIVQAAGTGQNNATQEQFSRTEWLLAAIILFLGVVVLLAAIRYCRHQLRRIVRQEIAKSELSKSRENVVSS